MAPPIAEKPAPFCAARLLAVQRKSAARGEAARALRIEPA